MNTGPRDTADLLRRLTGWQRTIVATLVVFLALYVLDSFGVPNMFPLALLVGLGVLIARQTRGLAAQ